MPKKKLIGKVTHYFNKIEVAIIELTGNLVIGDEIHIKGHTTDFNQTVDSMQIEHEDIKKAGKGDTVGVKVTKPVRDGDAVYKVTSNK